MPVSAPQSYSDAAGSWLTVQVAAELLEQTPQAIRKACRAGKYRPRIERANGGDRYLIPLDALPPEAQVRYYADRLPKDHQTEEVPATLEDEADAYSRAPEWARRRADKYLTLLRTTEGMKGSELEAFIAEWNARQPDQATSYNSLMRMRKAYREHGIEALLPKYGKKSGQSKVPDHLFEHFKALYLKEGSPTLRGCWTQVLGIAREIDRTVKPSTFPSPRTFLRRLEHEVGPSVIYLARHGRQAWARKYGNHVDRDYSAIGAGEVWVSDHAQVDVAVLMPNGKIAFPWVTAWRCFKTGRWLGWFLHAEAPNSDHIFQSFYFAAQQWGLPSDVYIDNGKDYRSRDFAGGRRTVRVNVPDQKATAMLAVLDVTAHFALPYNARTKPIERDFRTNKEWFSKSLVGYRGGNVVERPEVLQQEIRTGKLIPYATFVELFDRFIEEVLHVMPSYGKNHNGLSRLEAWDTEFTGLRRVTPDALKLFCMRTSRALKIAKNGVRDSEFDCYYWGEWMSPLKGTQVYLRRDPHQFEEAWVFRASDDEFLGRARIDVFHAPALAKTHIERGQLRAAIAAVREDKKIAELMAKTAARPSAREIIASMALGAAALAEEHAPTEKPQQAANVIALTRMDEAIAADHEMRRDGTYDLAEFVPPEPPAGGSKGSRLKMFEYETRR